MTHRILLALDGSPLDEAAFGETRRIAAGGAEIHLLHVVPSRAEPVGTPLMGMADRSMAEPVAIGGTGAEAHVTGSFPSTSSQGGYRRDGLIHDQAVEYLERFRRRMRGVHGQDLVRTGEAAEAIQQVALMFNVDLIVMSTHARTGLARWFLGSISETVLRWSQLPVLLVRAGNRVRPERLRRILVYLDGTPESRSILSMVKPMAVRLKAEILLLDLVGRAPSERSHLVTRPSEGDPCSDLPSVESDLTASGATWKTVSARGDPAEEILRQAHSRNADLIAMSIRAPRGLSRVLGRGLAQAVLSRIDRPLLLQMPVIHGECSDDGDVGERGRYPQLGTHLRSR